MFTKLPGYLVCDYDGISQPLFYKWQEQ